MCESGVCENKANSQRGHVCPKGSGNHGGCPYRRHMGLFGHETWPCTLDDHARLGLAGGERGVYNETRVGARCIGRADSPGVL